MTISGFTFVHNALEGGYPIVEAIRVVQPFVDEVVVVDCESDDGTEYVLDDLGVRIVPGTWDGKAGWTLARAHALNTECRGDIVVHFEADEVYDPRLLATIRERIVAGQRDLAVYRLQLEQNFQRCRWYPEPVHRIFPRGSVIKVGHTTDRGHVAQVIPPEHGFLWDITNCFRDNWLRRAWNQAQLWDEEPQYRMTPLHFLTSAESLALEAAEDELRDERWLWTATPFAIPDILRPLVGTTKYEARL